MTLQNTLSNPSVAVNDANISIVPNSLSYKAGKGDRKVRAQSAGGNSINLVVTEDAETKVSMLKFSLYNTQDSLDLLDSWQDNPDGNTIELSQGTLVKAFRRMVVTTDPERNLGADGNMEVEFQGQPI